MDVELEPLTIADFQEQIIAAEQEIDSGDYSLLEEFEQASLLWG